MNNQQYSPAGFRLLPPVVKNLLIINGLVFALTLYLQKFSGIELDNLLGLHYFKSGLFRPYQFVTYMFLHGDFWHILFNMFALWMFGYLLENVWGSKRFLTYYILTGIGAGVVQTLVLWWQFSSIESSIMLYNQGPSLDSFVAFVKHHFPQFYNEPVQNFISAWASSPGNPDYARQSVDLMNQMFHLRIDVPTIGASGAVYGILLAFGVMFPNMLVYLYFFIPIKAKWIVLGYGAIELFSGISNNPSDNVAHFAHLGGMLFGLILILWWRKRSFH